VWTGNNRALPTLTLRPLTCGWLLRFAPAAVLGPGGFSTGARSGSRINFDANAGTKGERLVKINQANTVSRAAADGVFGSIISTPLALAPFELWRRLCGIKDVGCS
jgi:hypothetical protein